MKLTGENRSIRTRRKTCPSVTLSTTNPTWTDPGSNPGLRGERPATNRISHGTAIASNILSAGSLTILNRNKQMHECSRLLGSCMVSTDKYL
jgi:hypothetical protein